VRRTFLPTVALALIVWTALVALAYATGLA
jgi:hypothetical protein